MQLEHHFTLPMSSHRAWLLFDDVERMAAAVPGATLDSVTDSEASGLLRVRVGPAQVTYRGSARRVERDDEERRLVVEASGKEVRGNGLAVATLVITVDGTQDQARVEVRTDLAVTGRLADADDDAVRRAADRVVAQFAQRLSDELEGSSPAPAPSPVAGAGAEPTAPPEDTRPARTQQLLSPDGLRVLGPTVGAAAVVLVLLARRRLLH